MTARAEMSSAESVLVVVPAETSATIVAGLPQVTRIARAARAAGYDRVLVGDGAPQAGASRVVVVPATVVPQAAWLRALRETPMEPETMYVDPAPVIVVQTERVSDVVAVATRSRDAARLLSELSARFDRTKEMPAAEGRFVLGSTDDVAAAERWLLRSLVKHNEGFMSRHFERRVSLAITRRLARTAITPNMITLASLAVGLLGAPFFLSSAPAYQLTGALIFLAHSILDGCDGELARLKFLHSRSGAMLDYWSDNAVHVAVFLCIGAGWAMTAMAAWPLLLGAVASAGALGSAAVMFEHTATDRQLGAESAPVTRLAAMLASRDFIYAIILLSLFGKAAWFLGVAAVGTPGFFAMVLWNQRRHGRVR
ncbi:MAG TPA: CDP-alcohol phosphatidyltransferase family protein [Methylomirabilota bacterium]|jgi:phosphatidylglycerophosphate synthase|nr:CDP-alcohol phosphatidyltransferase family protein [Methylomirabilota bacterium]